MKRDWANLPPSNRIPAELLWQGRARAVVLMQVKALCLVYFYGGNGGGAPIAGFQRIVPLRHYEDAKPTRLSRGMLRRLRRDLFLSLDFVVSPACPSV